MRAKFQICNAIFSVIRNGVPVSVPATEMEGIDQLLYGPHRVKFLVDTDEVIKGVQLDVYFNDGAKLPVDVSRFSELQGQFADEWEISAVEKNDNGKYFYRFVITDRRPATDEVTGVQDLFAFTADFGGRFRLWVEAV